MKKVTWKTDSVHNITPDEFYNLISRNVSHIEKTFPVTLLSCETLEKTTNFIAEAITKQLRNDGYYYYIRDIQSNSLIGYICIKNINTTLSKCELAYFIDKDHEGKGIISKAVGNIVNICFSELGMNKVYICTSPINYASQKVAIKQGFKKEGILRDEFRNGKGILEDVIYFGLLKSNYENNRAQN
jgi:ribosomal-protein-serine acetyltransferase